MHACKNMQITPTISKKWGSVFYAALKIIEMLICEQDPALGKACILNLSLIFFSISPRMLDATLQLQQHVDIKVCVSVCVCVCALNRAYQMF